MKVVMVEPNKPAYVTEIGNDFESIRDAVGGYFQIIPYLEDAMMIGNDGAKLIGMEGNRRFGNQIVAGPFFICGSEVNEEGDEDFCSLSDELCKKYVKQFEVPEHITQAEVQANTGWTIIAF